MKGGEECSNLKSLLSNGTILIFDNPKTRRKEKWLRKA
jgi:hypothetical protein